MTKVGTVVVAGRDASLWLTAATIRQALGPAGVIVRAVELPTALAPGDCHASQPALEALHARLGIEEESLLRVTRGGYSLGQNVVDTTKRVAPFMMPFGSFGTQINGKDFFAHWLMARSFGLDVALEHFSLTAAAARQGRVLFPDDETERYGRCDYGYHLPAVAYARCLKELAAHLGIDCHEASSIESLAGANGIKALLLDGGRVVAGDLFIDAGAGLVADHSRESWRGEFPVDRILTATGPRFASVPSYAEIRAGEWGWTALHPTAAGTPVAHVWSSQHRSDDEAARDAAAASGLPLGDVAIRSVDPGRLADPWSGNCIAIGDAAFIVDPIHDLGLHLVQLGLVHLLACFPASSAFAAQRAEYNRIMRSTVDRLRDFQSAFYVTSRFAGPFWDGLSEIEPSPELRQILATFTARGEIGPFEDESIAPDSWRALLIGQGIVPKSYLPPIDRTDPHMVKDQFRNMLGFVRDQVLRQPTHDALLEQSARG